MKYLSTYIRMGVIGFNTKKPGRFIPAKNEFLDWEFG
jgi:hypothetical protein